MWWQLSPYYRFSQFFKQLNLSLDKRSAKSSSAPAIDSEVRYLGPGATLVLRMPCCLSVCRLFASVATCMPD